MLQRGALDNALAYVDSSIQLNTILGNKRDIGLGLFNSSIIYRQLGDTAMALEAIEKALHIFTEINEQRGIAFIHNTLGLILTAQNKYDTALVHLSKALEIRKRLNDKMGIGVVHSNLGRLYSRQNRLKAAAENFNKSLVILNELNHKKGKCVIHIELCHIALKEGALTQAQELGTYALLIAKELGYPDLISRASKLLSEVHGLNNESIKSLEHFELHLLMQDSLQSKDIQKKISNREMKFELVEKENERMMLQKENELRELAVQHQEETSNRQRWVILLSAGATLLILLLTGLAYRQYSLKKRSNEQLEVKNATIESQQVQITEGIEYARNLQRIIMVDEADITKELSDCLLINQPRNIVSGDFHWFKKVNGRIHIAMIDCTGHGVPGALISVIGNDLLHDIVEESPMALPGEILSSLHSRIIDILQPEEGEKFVNAGMEMGICTIDKKNNTMEFAGANMPLFMLKGESVEELRPDIQSIGYSAFFRKVRKNLDFKTNQIPLKSDTSYYMVTDGFIDQFGTRDKEKYGKNRLMSLLAKTSDQNMIEQKNQIIQTMGVWMGSTTQTDDLSMIGFRI